MLEPIDLEFKNKQKCKNYSYLCPIGNQIAGSHPFFTGRPTIQFQSKNMQKIRCIKPLNRKRKNSKITDSNSRTACKEWSIRDPLRSRSNKIIRASGYSKTQRSRKYDQQPAG
jgi:hypothetical protein